MAKFLIVVLVVALVAVSVTDAAKKGAKKRQDAEEDGGDGGGGDEPAPVDAELTITVDNEKAVLVCGDPTTVEGRRKGKKGKQIPLHEAADEACKTLAGVEDLKELAPAAPGSDPCTKEELDESEVKIEGRFKGKTVNYKRKFRNKCQLQAVAPEVFDLKGEGEGAPNEAQGRKKAKGKKGKAAWVHWGRR